MAALAGLKVDREMGFATDSEADFQDTTEFTMQGAVMSIPPVKAQVQTQLQNSTVRDMQQTYQSFGNSANFCVNCGTRIEKVNGRVPQFCVYCGQPTEQNGGADSTIMKSVDMNQIQPAGVSHQMFKPELQYGNQMQGMQMPMQQFSQNGNYNSPAVMQTPDGAMMMCFPMGNQNGMFSASSMLAPTRQWATGMVPMTFAQFE